VVNCFKKESQTRILSNSQLSQVTTTWRRLDLRRFNLNTNS